ncbi:MAG: DegT/DnrJ/EryC1/StrS family aminotransferase [Desulfomonile tiedjei]|uniref:DegT/DnrJ/EryC1/StrS family aminotransferase n=1 Tax=Desulfomonile tiedjei TaxID=2358 RepID=A0A9D6V142_9BACT|nr:DegT/DnrJ/EryC1/StrS family aminotransferase [Desulfomonile tiedjei]
MNWKVPLADLHFGPDEYQAVRRVLESGWISMGPETELFECEFAEYLGVGHAVALSSGTAALHLALMALGIGPGHEVIVPSLTFVATVNAIVYTGATPVFADISSAEDWNVSPKQIEQLVTPETKALMLVHYGGFPCRLDRIKEIAVDRGLKIIEDAAHAPGAVFRGKKLGTWGDVGCFSFFSNKNMTTAEGGMAVTEDSDVAAALRTLRSHGMTSLTWDRHRGHSFSYDVVRTGYNYRIDEIRSAIGRSQLARLEENNSLRREITRTTRKLLAQEDMLSIPFPEEDLDNCSCHIFPILLKCASIRDSFMAFMKQQGIQTSIHYPPVHRFTAYADIWSGELPVTEDIASRMVTLPLFPGMNRDQIDLIASSVASFGRTMRNL